MEPGWRWSNNKRCPKNRLFWVVEEEAVVNHADTRADIIEGMAWVGTPGGCDQSVNETRPDVDTNAAVLEAGNGLVNRFWVALLRLTMKNQRAGECSPDLLIDEWYDCLQKVRRVFGIDADMGQDTAEGFVGQGVFTLLWCHIWNECPRDDVFAANP